VVWLGAARASAAVGTELAGLPSRHPAAAADWTRRKYCSCGYNKFMFLMYQVGAGTSMFALGETLSLFLQNIGIVEVLQQIQNNKYKYKLLKEFQEFHADYFYCIGTLICNRNCIMSFICFFSMQK
jgi:hypothetical protein